MKIAHSHHSELLTKHDAARALNVCQRTIENLMTARRLAFIRIGRAVRIERAALERYKQSQTIEAVE